MTEAANKGRQYAGPLWLDTKKHYPSMVAAFSVSIERDQFGQTNISASEDRRGKYKF
jgi:hypothetical protein